MDEILQAQLAELQRNMTLVSHWHNTMKSPMYKRLWWVCQGYRLSALGTWYDAPWNRTGGEKYNGKLG